MRQPSTRQLRSTRAAARVVFGMCRRGRLRSHTKRSNERTPSGDKTVSSSPTQSSTNAPVNGKQHERPPLTHYLEVGRWPFDSRSMNRCTGLLGGSRPLRQSAWDLGEVVDRRRRGVNVGGSAGVGTTPVCYRAVEGEIDGHVGVAPHLAFHPWYHLVAAELSLC